MNCEFRVAFGVVSSSTSVIVKIVADNSLVGYGEAAPFPFVTGESCETVLHALELFRQGLVGMDAMDIEGIHAAMDGIVSLSAAAEDSHAPAFEGGAHTGGELPGGGNRDGKGSGKGLGLGKGNGQGTSRAVFTADVFRIGISYASILLWFAIVTATLESGIRKVRRRQTCQQLRS